MANPANANRLWLILVFMLAGLLLLLIVSNWRSVTLSVGSLSFAWPLGAIMLVVFAMGKLACYAFLKSLDKAAVNEGKLLEWQAQDAKLAASVTSDRERQLEAKIATLETALKTALKKKV